MTDQDIARALNAVNELERLVRTHLGDAPEPGECDIAVLVARQTTCLKRPLERWIATRAGLAEQKQRQIATA